MSWNLALPPLLEPSTTPSLPLSVMSMVTNLQGRASDHGLIFTVWFLASTFWDLKNKCGDIYVYKIDTWFNPEVRLKTLFVHLTIFLFQMLDARWLFYHFKISRYPRYPAMSGKLLMMMAGELGGITIGWRELPTIYFDNLCLLLEHAQTPRNPGPTTITRGA